MLPGFFFRSYMARVTVPLWLSLVFYHGEMLSEGESTLDILLPEDAEGRTYALRQGRNRGGLIFVMAYDSLSSVNGYGGGTCRVAGPMVRAFQNAMARLPGITASLVWISYPFIVFVHRTSSRNWLDETESVTRIRGYLATSDPKVRAGCGALPR